MTKIDENIGKSAGKIWRILNKNGPLSEQEIIKKIKMNKNNFYEGIGWLARENKIYKKGFEYNLGETNLINDIGSNAGKVWNLLNSQGKCNVSNIVKINKIKIQDAYSALGWLAREDKIRISKGKQINYVLK